MRLVKLGFHFGGVPVRLEEVVGVSTSRKSCLSLVRLSECGGFHCNACHSGAPDFSELRVFSRTPMVLPWV